ncbi:MAG: twin-arginine translocase TatA/TatE family subunit [Spirochaetia bacterium]|nr:twin-arginine translocase TatA/TatE family subunit [Spirochaetia bacterium]
MILIGTPGIGEWAIILLLALLFFGKNKLPELARGLGSGIHEFRKGISGQFDAEDDREEPETPEPKKVARESKSSTSQKTAKKGNAKSSKSKV